MNNLQLALLQFEQAKSICQTDPLIFNEIGATYYKQANYSLARESLATALSLCKETNSSTYESILVNLANCHRKTKDFKTAIELYDQCLMIKPNHPQTYLALGLSHHQLGQIQEALNYYHKAHFISNDDAMIEQLVSKALEDMHEFPIEDGYLKL